MIELELDILIFYMVPILLSLIIGVLAGVFYSMQKQLKAMQEMQLNLKEYNKSLSEDYRINITSLKSEINSLKEELDRMKHSKSFID